MATKTFSGRELCAIAGAFRPMSAAEIERLRGLFRASIPLELLEFLAEFGECAPAACNAVRTVSGKLEPLMSFLGTSADHRVGLLSVVEHGREAGHLPDGMLPFAHDEFGNYYAIDLRDGRVRLLLTEEPPASDDDDRWVVHDDVIAGSFRDFFERLAHDGWQI